MKTEEAKRSAQLWCVLIVLFYSHLLLSPQNYADRIRALESEVARLAERRPPRMSVRTQTDKEEVQAAVSAGDESAATTIARLTDTVAELGRGLEMQRCKRTEGWFAWLNEKRWEQEDTIRLLNQDIRQLKRAYADEREQVESQCREQLRLAGVELANARQERDQLRRDSECADSLMSMRCTVVRLQRELDELRGARAGGGGAPIESLHQIARLMDDAAVGGRDDDAAQLQGHVCRLVSMLLAGTGVSPMHLGLEQGRVLNVFCNAYARAAESARGQMMMRGGGGGGGGRKRPRQLGE